MKKLLLSLALLALLAMTGAWLRPVSGRAFATTVECAEAFYRAYKDADAVSYLGCLTDELRRSYGDRAVLAADLQMRSRELRGWALVGEESAALDGVMVLVDEQLSTGRRRQKLLLQKSGSGWRIARVERGQDLPEGVPYGTHISQER
jgi:hypothetical protein